MVYALLQLIYYYWNVRRISADEILSNPTQTEAALRAACPTPTQEKYRLWAAFLDSCGPHGEDAEQIEVMLRQHIRLMAGANIKVDENAAARAKKAAITEKNRVDGQEARRYVNQFDPFCCCIHVLFL